MAVKYHCLKCGKRYADWGAEKLAYNCPECEGEKLVLVDHMGGQVAAKPTLKRKRKQAAKKKPPPVPAVPALNDQEDLAASPADDPGGAMPASDGSLLDADDGLDEDLGDGDVATDEGDDADAESPPSKDSVPKGASKRLKIQDKG